MADACTPAGTFAQAVAALHEAGIDTFLEIGPKPTLIGMGRRCLPKGTGTWLASLRPEQEAWNQMLESLADLYRQGASVDWAGFDHDYGPQQRLTLPTYPFQRQRYWFAAKSVRRGQLSLRCQMKMSASCSRGCTRFAGKRARRRSCLLLSPGQEIGSLLRMMLPGVMNWRSYWRRKGRLHKLRLGGAMIGRPGCAN
ncbi:MAG: hypothetical protein R3E31_29460 [Chloroflexota bacterium]